MQKKILWIGLTFVLAIGIPFSSSSFDAPGENYTGHARILAPTIGYQRFWWNNYFIQPGFDFGFNF